MDDCKLQTGFQSGMSTWLCTTKANLSSGSAPYLRQAPSVRGGHKVLWCGCGRGRRSVEPLRVLTSFYVEERRVLPKKRLLRDCPWFITQAFDARQLHRS
jgi:hypothetical protein